MLSTLKVVSELVTVAPRIEELIIWEIDFFKLVLVDFLIKQTYFDLGFRGKIEGDFVNLPLHIEAIQQTLRRNQ